MKIAIIGLSNSGRTTLFNALTRQRIETTVYPESSGSPHLGVVNIPDMRVDKLAEIFKPQKTVYAAVEYIDYQGLTKGDAKQNRAVFEHIKDADALIHVVRAFKDEAVMHPMGSIDPIRDIEVVESELAFVDFELVEKRLEAMTKMTKTGKKPNEEEKRVLLKSKDVLEKEMALRDVIFTDNELKAARHLQFLSIKSEVIVINIDEGDLNGNKAGEIQDMVKDYLRDKESSVPAIVLSGKIEMEIAALPPLEAGEFLLDLGIDEPACHRLIRTAYDLLGLISFFTVGADEVRAWTIKKGMNAHAASGKIHSDIEKGFIKAEVISCEDFMKAGGSMASAKAKGLLRLEGKTYEVKDGDIIEFRFGL